MVWYSHLLKNFPVYCDPHKGFGVVIKAKVDIFMELSCFFDDPAELLMIQWMLAAGNCPSPRWLSGKESACQCRSCQGRGLDPWVQKIPWRRKWQPTPVFWPGKSHEQRSLVG